MMAANREGMMDFPAPSRLKRSRTLPNCSRDDRTLDRPFDWLR